MPDSSSEINPRVPVVWIEKTIVRKRPDRIEGPHRLGEALWSPQRSSDNRDIYANMREARPGDTVLHFVDNDGIAGVSQVESLVDMSFVGLPATDWAGQPAYRIQLRGYRPLNPPFERGWLFEDDSVAEQVRTIAKEPRGRGIFFNDRLELNQGAYLTEAPKKLIELLNFVYGAHTGQSLFESPPSGFSDGVPQTGSRPAGEQRAWLYSPGNQAMYWDSLYESGTMALGWNDLGDFRAYPTFEAMKDALGKELGNERDQSQNAKMCFDFAKTMRLGDIIYAKRGRQAIVGRGIVTSEYRHDPTKPDQHNIRKVQWTARGEWPWPEMMALKTLTDVTDRMALFERLFNASPLIADDSKPIVLSVEALQPYSLNEAMDGLFLPRERFEQLLKMWHNKQNLILQGAPGVGKSFIARRLAYALMGFRDSTRVRTVQFHQSYAYEDFVQGYRPNGTGFALRDGVFLNFCKRALEDKSEQRYVFVIDEINRGNLSKILGELMLLIEPDKRKPEWAVKLAYAESADERFYVPANIYILGMMNTADRSLAVVDYALRRRFAFATLQPCFHQAPFRALLLERGASPDLVEKIVNRMGALNGAITADTTNLGAGYCIGHSFFTSAKEGEALDEDWYGGVINAEIVPLLEEYWFDLPDKVASWRAQLLA